jgi:uncharacterized membrane protein
MINNLLNLLVKTAYAAPNVSLSGSDPVGTIALPSGIPSEVAKTGDFITAIVRFILIIGGLFTLWQFLSGGLSYITSNGDKAKISEASNKITMSLTGLVIMAASFVIIAIVSKLLFGSFTAILIPQFTSVTP